MAVDIGGIVERSRASRVRDCSGWLRKAAGHPVVSAARASITEGSSSYSTATCSAASSAAVNVSATTMATASPTCMHLVLRQCRAVRECDLGAAAAGGSGGWRVTVPMPCEVGSGDDADDAQASSRRPP